MSIAGILFDKDGTLIEQNDVWIPIYRRTLMRLKGIGQEEAEQLLIQVGYDAATKRMKGGSLLAGGTSVQLAEAWWPEARGEELAQMARLIDQDNADAADTRVTQIVDLGLLFSELRDMGLRLGVATNDSEGSARRHLDQLGVLAFMDDVIGCDSVPVAKPSGNMIRRFSDKTGLPPDAIAMVGDNHHDMEEAVNGGAGRRIAVLSGNSTVEHLDPIADAVLRHVGEVPSYIRSLHVL